MIEYKRTPGTDFLERIKRYEYMPPDRGIVEEKLEELRPNFRESYEIICERNLDDRLVRTKELWDQKKGLGLATLLEKELVGKFTCIEILCVFCSYDREYSPPWKFPNENLKASLWDELKLMRGSRGRSVWPKKLKSPLAPCYGRYLIALESRDGREVYHSILF